MKSAEMVSVADAKAILGSHFVGIKDVEDVFPHRRTPLQKRLLLSKRFPRGVLEQKRETHMLFPGCSLSIQEMYLLYPEWFKDCPFPAAAETLDQSLRTGICLRERVQNLWHLVEMTPGKSALKEKISREGGDFTSMMVCELMYCSQIARFCRPGAGFFPKNSGWIGMINRDGRFPIVTADEEGLQLLFTHPQEFAESDWEPLCKIFR